MNERIRELIKSLGIIPENEHYEVVELIVRECAEVAGYYYTRNQCVSSTQIKQYFGVV